MNHHSRRRGIQRRHFAHWESQDRGEYSKALLVQPFVSGRSTPRQLALPGLFVQLRIALTFEWVGDREANKPPDRWAQDASEEYAALWQRPPVRGGRRRESPGPAAAGRAEERLNAFRRLSAVVPDRGRGRRALLLLDPDGAPAAWSGEGLLHEPAPEEVPRSGRAFKASFTAVTFLAVGAAAVRPAGAAAVAGRGRRRASRPTGCRSRACPGHCAGPLSRIAARAAGGDAPGAVRIASLHGGQAGGRRHAAAVPWTRRVVWGAIAFSLLALAVMRSPGVDGGRIRSGGGGPGPARRPRLRRGTSRPAWPPDSRGR